VVALVDQPGVTPAAVERLRAAHLDGARAAVATYAGRPRNPVVFDRSLWTQVAQAATGDEGARPWLRAHPELVVRVDCTDAGSPDDVDTPQDLAALAARADPAPTPHAREAAHEAREQVHRPGPGRRGVEGAAGRRAHRAVHARGDPDLVDGDAFEGTVKVKVGPINLTYGGKARFVSKDDATHVAVIDGSGKETRGTGTAKALITCRLIDQGDTTDVEVDTDLNVTGKPAQFGRGVLADVSGKLVDQFAACLSDEIRSGTPTAELAADEQAAVLSAPEPGAGDAQTTDQAAPVAAPAAASAAAAATTSATASDTGSRPPGAPPPPPPPAPTAAPTATATAPGPRAVTPRQAAEPIDLLGRPEPRCSSAWRQCWARSWWSSCWSASCAARH
jgi:carbon monoxide dehydrogenase subunit G